MKAIGCLFATAAAGVVMVVVISVSVLFPSVGSTSSPSTTGCPSTSTATGKLSAAEVAAVAYAAGFRGQDLQVAVAITEPESGADTTAVQNGGPIGAPLVGVGLFQITPGTEADLDPATNAAHAYAKYTAAHGFTPWTTYTGGEYKAWMGWAAAGIANMSAAGMSCQTTQTTSAVQLDVANAATGKVVQEATPPGLPASFDSYPGGQCTYYVALHHPVPPFLGNAATWWQTGPAKGMQTSSTPQDGWVVVYGSGGGYSSAGHVAIVLQVDSPTSFVVEEMNYLGTWVIDQRSSSMTDVEGFLN